jgi:hypothetical protein
MHVYICSKDRPEAICTPAVLQGCRDLSYTVLLHDDDQYRQYMDAGKVQHDEVLVTHQAGDALGKVRQMNWILDNLVQPGEWCVFADDNIEAVHKLAEPWYSGDKIDQPTASAKEWRARYGTVMDACSVYAVLQELIDTAEGIGARYGGFAWYDNYFFRQNKWKHRAFVRDKLSCLYNDGTRFYDHITLEDHAMTAQQLLMHGCTVVNNYVKPIHGELQPGGLGTYEERLPYSVPDCAWLVNTFGRLYRYSKKKYPKNFVYGSMVTLNLHTAKQIAKWREEMRKPRYQPFDRTPI